jgi:hypothetical protein
MRCFVRQIGSSYHAAFDWSGVSYTHSLRTKNERKAEVRLGSIRDTLYRLEQGTLSMPAGANAKVFILSGGNHASKPEQAPSLSVSAVADLYLGAVEKIEPNTKKTKAIHLNHIKRVLGADKPLDAIRLADAQECAKARRKQKHHGRHIQGYTVRKELRTFHQVWTWAASQGHTPHGPSWSVDAVELPKDQGREPFREFEQITRIIGRGRQSEPEKDRLWGHPRTSSKFPLILVSSVVPCSVG